MFFIAPALIAAADWTWRVNHQRGAVRTVVNVRFLSRKTCEKQLDTTCIIEKNNRQMGCKQTVVLTEKEIFHPINIRLTRQEASLSPPFSMRLHRKSMPFAWWKQRFWPKKKERKGDNNDMIVQQSEHETFANIAHFWRICNWSAVCWPIRQRIKSGLSGKIRTAFFSSRSSFIAPNGGWPIEKRKFY